METTKYLQSNSLANLKEEFGIDATIHHSDGRIILNYSQIDSHHCKYHPIVRECRGLVLDSNYNLIARAFPRFYNVGEEQDSPFNWSNFSVNEKMDGSLILCYWWNNDIHINTRGSFGHGLVGKSKYSWRDLFFQALGPAKDDVIDFCKKNKVTLVFELCTPYSQVVAYYDRPRVFLLSIFCNSGDYEEFRNSTQFFTSDLGLETPPTFSFSSLSEIEFFITQKGKENPTFEGVVCRDNNDYRIKIKSLDYLRLHRLNNNGHLSDFDNLLDAVLSMETDEIVSIYPLLKKKVKFLEHRLFDQKDKVDELWNNTYRIVNNRKDFALKVKHSPFAYLLFTSFDTGNNPSALFHVDEFRHKVIKTMSSLYKAEYENYC